MRAGNTTVITVSLPDRLAEVLNNVCEEHDFNRSQLIASAIKNYLAGLGVEVREKMTNGDYIRHMTDDELADKLDSCNYCSLQVEECDGKCYQHIKEWLEQERKCEQE